MNLLKRQLADDDSQQTDETVPGDTDLLTRSDVAALLKVCQHTVARRTRSGELPCVIFSRRLIRYERAVVREFILAAKVHTKNDVLVECPLPASLPPRQRTQGVVRNLTGNASASSAGVTRGKGAAVPKVTGTLAVQEDVQ